MSTAIAVGTPEAGHAEPSSSPTTDPGVRDTVAERRRVVLRGTDGDAFVLRVRGQLADLDVEVELGEAGLESALDERQSAAEQLARERDADLVVWLEAGEPVTEGPAETPALVAVWFRDSRELYTRRVGPSHAALVRGEDSAALETAALTVRSALRSLVRESPPPTAPPAQPTEPKATASVRPRAEHEREPPRSFELGLGAAARVTGLVGHAHLGPRLHAGVRHGRLRAVGVLSAGLPWRTALPDTEFELRQDRLSLESSVNLLSASALELGPLLRASLERTVRQTLPGGLEGSATEPRAVWDYSIGVALWTRLPLFDQHGLQLQLGADWQPNRVRYLVEDTSGAPVSVGRPWHLQPAVGLGWSWLL